MKKHANIPIFIPELACPHQCVFCDQQKISGSQKVPEPREIKTIIDQYLCTIPKGRIIQIAFYGGNFTGIPIELQEHYLKEAQKYVENGSVQGIRLSTRPDYINEEIIHLLKKYGVSTVELGAQSTNDEVLKRSGRGHLFSDIVKASKLIKESGIELGLQMMIGLPGDNFERSYRTAEDIISLGARNTRIYPTLVVKGTKLADMYLKGLYDPLGLEEAVQYTKEIYLLFIKHKLKVLRTGLHPSGELMPGHSLIAGPYHVSFKELVLTEIWTDILKKALNDLGSRSVRIKVPESQLNYAVGFKGKNLKEFKKQFDHIKFIASDSLTDFDTDVSSY
jgi:histone acetyltransferase (RNA polymerase elongator complex component)